MKPLLVAAALAALLLSPACGLIPLPSAPAAVPTFYLPTDWPTATPTPLPTSTATPTPTATALPVLPAGSGQIYVTLAERPVDAKYSLRLARFPAGCVDCPDPVEIPAFVNPTGAPAALAWSPDGSTAALAVSAYEGAAAAVLFYHPAARAWTTAAEFEQILSALYWSPDGMLAVYALQDGKADYYTISADGAQVTNVSRRVLSTYKEVLPAGWLNGELVFSAWTTRGLKAHSVGVQYPRVRILSNIPVFTGYEQTPLPLLPSPDGKWIAFSEITPRVGQTLGLLRVKDTEVSHALVSSKDGRVTSLAWSPDGDWLALALRTGATTEVNLIHPDGSAFHPVYATRQDVRAIIFDPAGSGWLLLETAAPSTQPAGPSRLVLVHAESGETRAVRYPGDEHIFWEGASWQPGPQ